MAGFNELDSFLLKFKQLLRGGFNASLNVNAEAGQASVILKLDLNCSPGRINSSQQYVWDGPYVHTPTRNSRERRLHRREVDRQRNKIANMEHISKHEVSEKKDTNIDGAAEEAVIDVKEKATGEVVQDSLNKIDDINVIGDLGEEMKGVTVLKATAEKAAEDALENLDRNKVGEEAVRITVDSVDTGVTLFTNAEKTDMIDQEPVVNLPDISENDNMVDNSSTAKVDCKNTLETVGERPGGMNEKTGSKNDDNSLVRIFATAEIRNSSKSQLTDSEFKALKDILGSKDHLRRNLRNIRYENYDSYQEHRNGWQFYLPLIIDVDTAPLWENARSYVYHHLGRDSWELSDGTLIRLIRIHQNQYHLFDSQPSCSPRYNLNFGPKNCG